MRKQIVTFALAGSLGLTGAALLSPTLASAQTPSPSASSPVTDRLTAIKDALKGLVGDDTITQAQADQVAQTLAEQLPARGGHGGHGGHGPHGGRVSPEATAAVLGISVQELQTQREAGRTLAQIAEAEGVAKADLVKGLVAAAEEQLAADVAAGELTQAQADEVQAGLTERITQQVDSVGRGGRGHHGPRGGDDDADATPGSTASATPGIGA